MYEKSIKSFWSRCVEGHVSREGWCRHGDTSRSRGQDPLVAPLPVDQSEVSIAASWPTRGQYHLRKLSILSTRGGLVLDFLFLCSCLFMFSPKTSPVRSAEIRSSNSVCSGPLQHPCSISILCAILHPTLNKRQYGGWRQSYEKEKLQTSKEPISCVWGEVCCTVVWCVMVWLMFVYFLAVCLIEFWSRKTPNDQTIDC